MKMSDDVRDCECCEQGKHRTCLIEVWDELVEDWVACPCGLRGHDPDTVEELIERDNTARDDRAIDEADARRSGEEW